MDGRVGDGDRDEGFGLAARLSRDVGTTAVEDCPAVFPTRTEGDVQAVDESGHAGTCADPRGGESGRQGQMSRGLTPARDLSVSSYRDRCWSGTRPSWVAPPPPGWSGPRPEDLTGSKTAGVGGWSSTAEAPPPPPQWRPGLTESPVVGQLLVDLLHPLDVEPAALGVVDHGSGVVHAHHTARPLLHRLRGVPGLVDVAVGEVLQDGDVAPRGTGTGSSESSPALSRARGAHLM